MISPTILLALLPVIVAFALSRRRHLTAIIGMGLFSLILAAVYLLLNAPDVAITEAAIGAALVTFIYVIAIRKTGRLTVVGNEVPGLFWREGDRVVGLEQEILVGLAQHLGLDLVTHIVPQEAVQKALDRNEADIAAGGIVAGKQWSGFLSTPQHLPTTLFRVSKEGKKKVSLDWEYLSDVRESIEIGRPRTYTLDLARFIAISGTDLSSYQVTRVDGKFSYTFYVAKDREDLHRQLVSHIQQLKETGELDEIIGRYFA